MGRIRQDPLMVVSTKINVNVLRKHMHAVGATKSKGCVPANKYYLSLFHFIAP